MKKYSRKQAAQYLGVSPDTLAKWATVGRPWIPYYRLGGKAVYDQSALDAFLNKNKVEGGESE